MQRSKGGTVDSDRYVAPYFYAKIWALDPQSLQVKRPRKVEVNERGVR